MGQAVGTKEEKLNRLAQAVLALAIQQGVRRVTHAGVSRATGISRGWIYQTIGSGKDKLIETSARILGEAFSEVSVPFRARDRASFIAELTEGDEHSIEDLKSAPEIIEAYFRFRGSRNAFGEVIREFETRHLDKITRAGEVALGLSKADARRFAVTYLALRMSVFHRGVTDSRDESRRKTGGTADAGDERGLLRSALEKLLS